MTCRLALGTVQFGLPYGVANRQGQVSEEEAAAMLAFAREKGIDTLDTAIAYGNSEETLGRIGVNGWRIISKLPPVPDAVSDVGGWVRQQVESSLQRLDTGFLDGLLLHRPAQLLDAETGNALYAALCQLQAEGIVGKIGISVYQPDEFTAIVPHFPPFGLVQAPLNVIDRSLVNSGWLQRLHEAGTEVHVRSVFLQGLLLMNEQDRPERFRRWQPLWRQWHDWLQVAGVSALQACLQYPLSLPAVSRVVVGSDNLAQLRQIVGKASQAGPTVPDTLQSQDPLLINPSLWGSL